MTINRYLQANYDKLKNVVKKTLSKSCGYSDDIFHDTLCKIIELFKDREIDEEMVSYVVSAMRNNINRYKHYAYNERKVDAYENAVTYIGQDMKMDKFDFEVVMNEIERHFGESTRDIIYMFLEGFSVQEIQEKHKINNFYYVLKKVRHYVRDNVLQGDLA